MKYYAVLLMVLLVMPMVYANWSEQKVTKLTTEFNKHIPGWSIDETRKLALKTYNKAASYSVYDGYEGNKVYVEVKAGETVLINGKYVTGNLGSNITYGENSPIIQNLCTRHFSVHKRASLGFTHTFTGDNRDKHLRN